MIGRTNVPQRKSPTINGDIANFTVANGNTISVGDFVSYKLVEEIKTFNNNTYTKDFVLPYDEENDKYVVCLNVGTGNTEKLIQLVQVVNGDVEILDTISVIVSSGYEISFDVYNGSMWYVKSATISSNTLTFTVGNINIQNDEFVDGVDLTGSCSTASVVSNISAPTTAFVRNGRIFFSGYVTSGTGSSRKVARYCYWVKQSGGVYSVEGSCQTSNITSAISNLYHEFCSMQQNDIITVDKSGGVYCYVSLIVYDSVNDTYSFGNSVYVQTGTYSQSFAQYVNIAYNKQYLGLTLGYGNSSFVCDLKVYTVSNGVLTKIVDTSVSGVYSANSYPKVFCLKGNSFVCVSGVEGASYIGKYCKVLCCDIDEYGVSTVATKYVENTANEENEICANVSFVIPVSKTSFLTYGNKGGATKYFKSLIDYDNNSVSFGEFGNVVESYSGNFNVGFAKTSGVGGDTIQVYIPHQNS